MSKEFDDDEVYENDTPSPYHLADDEDDLSWSWQDLTGGAREEIPDDELEIRALFEGVDGRSIEKHKRELEELIGGSDAVQDESS